MKITISLRNKTKNYLNALLPEQKAALFNYLESFMALSEQEAFQELVKIKISPEDILSNNKKLDGIDAETLSKMCGDICTNYQKLHAVSWLSDDAYPATLRNAFCDDKTLLALIKMRVIRRIDSPKPLNIERLQFLLNSQQEKYRFGGLKELKFTDSESQFFKNKTVAISQYVCYMLSSNKTVVKPSIPEASKEAISEEAISEEVDVVHEETHSEHVAIQLSAANVIANADIIRDFLSAYDALEEKSEELSALGINPEEVIKSAVNIKQLLSAAANL